MKYAPIALFTYKRLAHTKETVEALQKNHLARESELFIFSDGAQSEKDKDKVSAVREYLKTISGFKQIHIETSEDNKGLANSIVKGVTEIINSYGKVIVLEDDLVTSPFFLTYMNEALETYEHDQEVMHINGYFFPHKETLPETFFFNQMLSWGWATWDHAWKHFSHDVDKALITLQQPEHKNKFYNKVILSQLKANKSNKISTWAAFWHASIAARKGFCLTPHQSLVFNSGNDDSGTHRRNSLVFDTAPLQVKINIDNIEKRENDKALMISEKILKQNTPSLFKKVWNKLQF